MFRLILLSLAILLAAQARGEVVEGLYAATVPVADQGAASLEAGAAKALSEVVVKVSGSESALKAPAVASAIKSARGKVQQYVFNREPGAGDNLVATFEFSGDYVTDLVSGAGLPIWPANRPRVLVWAVVEAAGERSFINPSDTPELAQELRQAFQRRGVPVAFPLFDLGDATAISAEAVWQQQTASAEAASARYAADDILLARVVEATSGGWVGDWAYLHRGERRDRSGDAPDAGAYFAHGADLVAAEMVARYAVAASGEASNKLQLGISGVQTFADYAAIINWLQALELVQQVGMDRIEGERMQISLTAALDSARLAQLLQLNRRLQPLQTNSPALDNSGLEYQWQN